MVAMLGVPTGKYWSCGRKCRLLPNRCWINTRILILLWASLPANVKVKVKVPPVGALLQPLFQSAHKFHLVLMEAQSQEEFVKRLEALPKHARDVHEWEGGRCDFHPLWVCTCKGCKDPEWLQCRGEPYKTKLKLACEFHAQYEIDCMERAKLTSQLVHSGPL